MGLNEAAGYLAVAGTALATGLVAARYGLRPEPFFMGIAFAGLGLGLSTLFVRETHDHARLEAGDRRHEAGAGMRASEVLAEATFRNRTLAAISQAGLVNNLNDGMAWGLLPIFYAAAGLGVGDIGLLAAVYPAVWGLGQLGTGALSDRIGRKRLIVAGMVVQAVAIGLIASSTSFRSWVAASVVLGAGTAMVYPTLLAAVGDVAHPEWRASAVGVYRLWRDAGFAIGAVVTGVVADLSSIGSAIWLVAALTMISGLAVAALMRETRPVR